MFRDEMFHLYTQLTAKINSKYIQKIYGINIEFADANKSLFFKGLIIYIYLYICKYYIKLDILLFIIPQLWKLKQLIETLRDVLRRLLYGPKNFYPDKGLWRRDEMFRDKMFWDEMFWDEFYGPASGITSLPFSPSNPKPLSFF